MDTISIQIKAGQWLTYCIKPLKWHINTVKILFAPYLCSYDTTC